MRSDVPAGAADVGPPAGGAVDPGIGPAERGDQGRAAAGFRRDCTPGPRIPPWVAPLCTTRLNLDATPAEKVFSVEENIKCSLFY